MRARKGSDTLTLIRLILLINTDEGVGIPLTRLLTRMSGLLIHVSGLLSFISGLLTHDK